MSEPLYCNVRQHYCRCQDYGDRCDMYDDLQEIPAKVLETEGVSQIEYRIVGDLDSVLAEIKLLLTKYDPMKYGTHVHWMDMEVDRSWMARVSRSK